MSNMAPDEERLTAAEWKSIEETRSRRAAARAPRRRSTGGGFSLTSLIPSKFSETGAQMTYLGMAGLIGVGVIALGGDAIDVIPIDLTTAITAFTALMGGGGVYRQVNKRHENNVESGMIEEDFGALPDEDEFGPDR